MVAPATSCTASLSVAAPPPSTAALPPNRAPAQSCTGDDSGGRAVTVPPAGSMRMASPMVLSPVVSPPARTIVLSWTTAASRETGRGNCHAARVAVRVVAGAADVDDVVELTRAVVDVAPAVCPPPELHAAAASRTAIGRSRWRGATAGPYRQRCARRSVEDIQKARSAR